MNEHSVSLGMYHGAMSLFLDGEAQSFNHFKINENCDLEKSLDIVKSEIPGIASSGINLCWVPVFINWKAPGEYDFSDMDTRINHVLELYDRNTPPGASKAAIVIRIQAAVFFPDWYINGNKVDGEFTNKVRFRNYWGPSEPIEILHKERFSTRNPRYSEPYAVSPGDKFWDTYAVDCLKAIVDHAKSQAYHERVFGWLPCALSTNEWFLHSDSPDSCCDFSAPMQHAFFEYLQGKGMDSSYQPVPTPREIFDKKELVLTPEDFADKRIEEFSLFLNNRVADIIENFSRIIKDCYREKNKLVGCFYGYTTELSPIYNLAQSAHLALRRLMKSPYIDFFCSPLQYRYRRDIRPFCFSQVCGAFADSMRLYGKLTFAEEDHWPARQDLFSRDQWHDEMSFRRSFAAQATHGQHMWWYSIGEYWFADKWRRDLIGTLHAAGLRELAMDRTPVSEIAVVVDERSIAAIRPNPEFWNSVLLHTYAGVYPAGAPFELFELEALLEKADPARYKTVIFLNLYRQDERTLAKINSLKNSGRTLIFMGFSGKIFDSADGKRTVSAENASCLTGMTMKLLPESLPYSLWVDPDRTEFLPEKEDLRFGTEAHYTGLVAVDDPAAETIAYWCDGSVGMARKHFPEWTSVFIGGVHIPDKLWRKIFEDAGVHCYAQCGDVAYANASMVAYSASSWGEKTLTMPAPERLTDVLTGETLLTGENNSCSFKMRRNEVRIFFREKA